MPAAPQNINSELETLRARYELPALAALLLQNDAITYQGAVGVRKLGDPTPVKMTDPFHMGSDTKAMTATLCGLLVEKNKLSWKSTIGDVLGKVAPQMRVEWKPVTLTQLIQQRSGLTNRNYPKGSSLGAMHSLPGTPTQMRQAFALLMLAEPPENAPGTTFLYSNVNYALVGLMAETVADKSWEDLMRQAIFVPLGMKTAGFGAMGTSKLPPDAPWQHRWVGGKSIPVTPGPHSDNPQTIAPAGLVHCSLADWAAFVQDHLKGERGEKTVLLRPETYRFLHTPPPGGDYAGGWITTNRRWGGSQKVWTHAGSNTMNYCLVWASPARNVAALIATNTGAPNAAKACDEAASLLIGKTIRPNE